MKNISNYFVAGLLINILLMNTVMAQTNQKQSLSMNNQKSSVRYHNIEVNGIKLFYREAGNKDAPTILLLHGYPTSSHMFRNLIPVLSEKYHVIAPDLPGFGYSDAPDHNAYRYTFDNLSTTMQGFIDKLGMKRFAVYIFDYGAPVGLRIAMKNPEKITGIISQNGNAYEEGLSKGWEAIQKYWKDPSQSNRDSLKFLVSEKATMFQYFEGVSDPSLIAPETYKVDQFLLDRPGNMEIQLDLVKDYKSNIETYPKFHEYFRTYKPKLLLVWGNKDPYFLPAGAEAYKKDLPEATLRFYNTGHFALETNGAEIGAEIMSFMATLPK